MPIRKELSNSVDFQDYIHHFFTTYNKCFRLLLLDQQDILAVDLKLKKKLFFMN